MSKHPDNPSAFPFRSRNEREYEEWGMTLRDYFAAAAISGYSKDIGSNSYSSIEAAESAYLLADSMLEEREKDYE